MKKSISSKIKNILGIALFSLGLVSCQFFENDVADYMETYTETAAIDQHSISETTHIDAFGHTCIGSKKEVEINLYMRNPKKFTLQPTIEFTALSTSIDRSGVTITQTGTDSLKLVLPQEFLLACDEGNDISSAINLYEPMSGRIFAGYTISLRCNSIPPKITVPTILNNNGQSFVLAFDMPYTEELALRNKDITAISINDVDYPLTIASDGTYTFESSSFSATPGPNLISINAKDFTHTTHSIYFQTNDAFVEGEKTYKLGLKDSAGLIQYAYASTSIDRLTSPLIKDIDNVAYASGSNEMVSGSTVEPFKITLIPPVTDHKGNPVDGTTMYYTLYRGTSTVAAVIQEGFSNSNVELEMVPGTYYVETYATKTNYEQSPVASATFRIVDNAIFVSQTGNDLTADGSRDLPFETLNAAIADVDVRNMPNAHLTIYIDGTVDGNATINCTQSRSITLSQKTGGLPAVLNGSGTGSTLIINTTVPVILKNIKVTGGNNMHGGGIYINSGSSLTLSNGAVVTGNTAVFGAGIYVDGDLSVTGASTVTGNTDSSSIPSNVYLPSGKTIKVTGPLTSGGNNSQIGVTTEDVPSILTAIPFTTDYGYNAGGFNAGVHPGTYFIADQFAINKDTGTGEATVFLNSGTFGELLSTLNMTFAISGPLFTTAQTPRFTAGTESVITITPTVTAGGTPVNYADIASNVTWSVKLTNGDVDVPGVTTSTTNSLTIPASVTAPDEYKILIQAICYGVFTFDDEITITGE